MNKQELLKKIADRADCSVDTARKYMTVIEDIVMEAIATEDKVRFSFGEIGGKTKPARVAHNPKTGEKVKVPEKHGQPYYKPSAKAKE